MNTYYTTMTQTTLKCGCSWNLVAHIINSILLLLVLVFQGSTLDFYLIQHNEGTSGWYFWFLADFLVLIAFMASGIVSYRFHKRKVRLQQAGQPEEVVEGLQMPPSKLGILPLSYVVWVLYALLLTAKIILLFKLDVAQTLDWKTTFSPQLLKVVIAFSIIVFMLLVFLHNDAKRGNLRHDYMNYLIGSIAFEILDSITFLEILFPIESKIILPYSLENAILILSCINFLLPGLALYILNQSKFSVHPDSVSLALLYNILHLFLINLPYFAIRIFLWTALSHDVSLFLLKNILRILITLRNIISDLELWWMSWKEKKRKYKRPVHQNVELSIIGGGESENGDDNTMIHMDEIKLTQPKCADKTHL